MVHKRKTISNRKRLEIQSAGADLGFFKGHCWPNLVNCFSRFKVYQLFPKRSSPQKLKIPSFFLSALPNICTNLLLTFSSLYCFFGCAPLTPTPLDPPLSEPL